MIGVWDAFLHRDWIRPFARKVVSAEPHFTNRKDATDHRLSGRVWRCWKSPNDSRHRNVGSPTRCSARSR